MTRPTPISDFLNSLGYSEDNAAAFAEFGDHSSVPGRVTIEHRGAWTVQTEGGEFMARAPGRIRHDARDASQLPVVGDWVAVRPGRNGKTPTIEALLPRTTCFRRKAAGRDDRMQLVAANIDVAFLVASLNRDLNPRRLERYLALAHESGATPVVVLTKADLCDDIEGCLALARAAAPGVTLLVVSAFAGTGLDEISAMLRPNRTGVLLGSSGAGKSTIANFLLGGERFATSAVREHDDRGRHTTTRRELVVLPDGGVLIDTPGMRELGLWDADAGRDEAFDEITDAALQCRFADCTHTNEPACAVLAALKAGTIDETRLTAWRRLRDDEASARPRYISRDAAQRAAVPVAAARRKPRPT
jgi:ribosome biogenesis GTPase